MVNGQNTWDRGEDGVVTIHHGEPGFTIPRVQKLFHTPRVSHIKLDEYGSFPLDADRWRQDCGPAGPGAEGEVLARRQEPLYDRLVKYMQILRNNRFILFVEGIR